MKRCRARPAGLDCLGAWRQGERLFGLRLACCRYTHTEHMLVRLQGEDDGATLVDLDSFVARREGERLTGVYALYDARRSLQYVGYARSIVLAIKVPLPPPPALSVAPCVTSNSTASPQPKAPRHISARDLPTHSRC